MDDDSVASATGENANRSSYRKNRTYRIRQWSDGSSIVIELLVAWSEAVIESHGECAAVVFTGRPRTIIELAHAVDLLGANGALHVGDGRASITIVADGISATLDCPIDTPRKRGWR